MADIRLALIQLPKTLDETYERILCNIPPESQDMSHKTLQLIATGYVTTLAQIVDLLTIDLEKLSFNLENRPLDPYAPIEAYTCLFTYNKDTDYLILSHYTVKEYLMSLRICTGPAKQFQMTNDSIHFLAATSFIVYMLYDTYEDYIRGAAYGRNPNSSRYEASRYWDSAVRKIESQSLSRGLSPLVIRLLNPARPQFGNGIYNRINGLFPHWSLEAGDESSITLAYLCWFGLIEAARVFLESDTQPLYIERQIMWADYRALQGALSDANLFEYLNTLSPEIETVSPLQLTATLPESDFLALFISEEAIANTFPYNGFDLF